MDAERDFSRSPSGYVLAYPSIGLVIEGRYMRWEHGALYGVVSVRTRMPGVKTVNGVVAELRVNLSGDRGRMEVAKACIDRSPEIDLDWRGFMEDFAISVMAAEREGRPFKAVGNLPARINPGHAIDPLFPTGRPAFVYGPPAATKGFLMVAMCLSVETGVTIIPGLVPRKGRALYLDWESDDWDIDDRVKKIARGAGIPGRPQIGYRECIGPLIDQVEDISREVHRSGTTFIVVDSVGMALSTAREGGDANESTIRIFQGLRPILAQGVTVVLVDHVTGSELGPKSRSSKPYGSVYKLALARNTYEIRPLKQVGDDEVRHVVIRHRKANTSAYLPDMGYAMTFGDGAVAWETEEVREEVDAVEHEGEKDWPPSVRVKMRAVLEKGRLLPAEIAEAIDEKVETVERVLRRYGPKASKAENRWFGRVASGKAENLPVDQEVLDKAGLWPRAEDPETADAG